MPVFPHRTILRNDHELPPVQDRNDGTESSVPLLRMRCHYDVALAAVWRLGEDDHGIVTTVTSQHHDHVSGSRV